MTSWNDYRYVLAISRAGNIPNAANQLEVNTSTVFRRLERIEELYAVKLFERHRHGYIATEAGQEIITAAERMEQEAFSADRALTGKDQQLTGRLRVTTTETLAASFLSRHIPSFSKEHPGLYVEIISDNQRLSLTEREADIALRPTRPKEESLIGKKIGILNWGVYGSRLHNHQRAGDPKDLTGHSFIAWAGGPLARLTTDWIKANVPDSKIVYESSSMITNAQLAANGPDLTLLPCLTGSSWQGLKPILCPLKGTEGELWLVTHKDLQKNARVRALLDYLTIAAKADQNLFSGKE